MNQFYQVTLSNYEETINSSIELTAQNYTRLPDAIFVGKRLLFIDAENKVFWLTTQAPLETTRSIIEQRDSCGIIETSLQEIESWNTNKQFNN